MIGVVISHHNNPEGLERCLESLQQQEVPHKVLVVDDCSSPDFDFAFPDDVVVEFNSINRGQQWCRNFGQLYFTNNDPKEYILFCDHDIVWELGALHLMLLTLQTSKESVGYVYSDYQRDGALKTHHVAGPFTPKRLQANNFISTMSLIKTKCLPQPAFIEEEERLQDWSLWLRLLNDGYIGEYLRNTLFTAHYNYGDISCGSTEDFYYWKKYMRETYVLKGEQVPV